ncbi:MAG: hypothetical protein ACTSRS_07655 [Candidatus Helarchaeota archaeon]
MGHTGVAYVVEFAIPLNSADPEDLQSTAGSVIGIALCVLDWGADEYHYPANTTVNYSAVSFQLAGAPSDIGVPLFLPVLAALGALVMLTRRLKSEPSTG